MGQQAIVLYYYYYYFMGGVAWGGGGGGGGINFHFIGLYICIILGLKTLYLEYLLNQ